MRSGRLAVLAAAALCLAGCGGGSDRALDRYAGATLSAGQGLGELRLGELSLERFLADFGRGEYSLVGEDERAFEFAFHDGQLAFQFLFDGECRRETLLARDFLAAARDLDAYLQRHPACRALTLSSLSVAVPAGMTLGGGYYEGATDQGSRLGAPISSAFAHRELTETVGRLRLVAGQSPDNPEAVLEGRGIRFYYDQPSSGKIEDTRIRRMTVFRE